jgi:hypothetical protein
MGDLMAKFRVATWVVHGLAAVVLLVLFSKTGVMASWCIVPGLLIACGSAASIPGRPLTLYAAFGAVLGLSFWLAVSAINQGFYLNLIPVLLLIVGVSWLLREPEWPSAIFTLVAIALELGITAMIYTNRDDIRDVEPEMIIKSLSTTTTMLFVGAVYATVGFAEILLLKKARKKKKSRAIRTPVDGPIL